MQFAWVIIIQVIIPVVSNLLIIRIEWVFASMNLMFLIWYVNVLDKIIKTQDWQIIVKRFHDYNYGVSKQMSHKFLNDDLFVYLIWYTNAINILNLSLISNMKILSKITFRKPQDNNMFVIVKLFLDYNLLKKIQQHVLLGYLISYLANNNGYTGDKYNIGNEMTDIPLSYRFDCNVNFNVKSFTRLQELYQLKYKHCEHNENIDCK